MMPGSPLFFWSRLGRAYAELAIHRNRIAINDLAVKTGCEFKREGSFAAGRGAKDYDQQGIARQLTRAPVNVVPEASDGDSENENHDYDEADILQPSVRRGRFAGLSPLCAGQ